MDQAEKKGTNNGVEPCFPLKLCCVCTQKKGKGFVSVLGEEKTIRLNSILPKTHLLAEWGGGGEQYLRCQCFRLIFRLLLLKGSWVPPPRRLYSERNNIAFDIGSAKNTPLCIRPVDTFTLPSSDIPRPTSGPNLQYAVSMSAAFVTERIL